jgi:hypothetical protein
VCEKMDNDSVCFRDGLQLTIITHLAPQGWALSFSRQSGMPDALTLSDQQIVEAENAAGVARTKANKLAPILEVKP